MYISKPDNNIKDWNIKFISAKLKIRSRLDYQMYLSKADDKIRIELSKVYQQKW